MWKIIRYLGKRADPRQKAFLVSCTGKPAFEYKPPLTDLWYLKTVPGVQTDFSTAVVGTVNTFFADISHPTVSANCLKKFCEKPSVIISLQNSKTLY